MIKVMALTIHKFFHFLNFVQLTGFSGSPSVQSTMNFAVGSTSSNAVSGLVGVFSLTLSVSAASCFSLSTVLLREVLKPDSRSPSGFSMVEKFAFTTLEVRVV